MNKDYIPLYRKYRPQSIQEIVGQEHIKKALANAIETDRISHAYLFTGPRGTGKTSTARIFAKSLNCEKGPSISPCNECENCKNITNSIPIDVIEIDAASNRSVSDADDIIQKVALAPIQSRYKIYIIDEVHMLTNQAFNALLKTLEEPPKNVIFILATTEVHKVLDTIKSRCQRFDFKRITTQDIVNHLKFISEKEKINITDDALYYIAQNSAGGMRDSIALLDQLSVLNSSDSEISVEDINLLLGRLSFESLSGLYKSIIASDQVEALNILNQIYNQGNEPVQILSNLLEYLRNALILKATSGMGSTVLQLNEQQIKKLQEMLDNVEAHQIISLINKCCEYIRELKLTTNPKLWLDVAILDLSNLSENSKLEDLQRRISNLESGDRPKQTVNTFPYNAQSSPIKKAFSNSKAESISKNVSKSVVESSSNLTEEEILTSPVPLSKQAEQDNLKTLWNDLLANISSFPSRAILKQQAIPIKITQEEVIITIKNQSWLKQFGHEGPKHEIIVDAVNKLFDKPVLKIIVRESQEGDLAIKNSLSGVENDKKSTPEKSQGLQSNENEQFSKEDIDDAISQKGELKIQPANTHNNDEYNHTSEVNMIVDLFDGKIID